MAIRGPGEGERIDDMMAPGEGAARRVFRFGQKIRGRDLPTVPERARFGPEGPSGRLVGAQLRLGTRDVWLKLRSGEAPWARTVHTIALNSTQPRTPTPDSIELRDDMRLQCHDGYVGRLVGLALNTLDGALQELIVRIRGNVLADVASPSDPMVALLNVAGRDVLVPGTWIEKQSHEEGAQPFGGGGATLHLNASPEQIAAGMLVRPDGDLSADIWSIWNENPAIVPYAGQLRVLVHDGDVTLRGALPSPRHRASAEQDVWHVPGVFAVHNEIVVA